MAGMGVGVSEVEECVCGACGDGGDFFEGDAAEGGDVCGDEWYVGAFVALSAVWDWGEVGGVGFEEDVFEGDGGGDGAEGGVFECCDAADAYVEAHFDGAVCFLEAAAEAVEDAAVAGAVDLFEECEEFVVGFADVEADG